MAETELVVVTVAQLRLVLRAWLVAVGVTASPALEERLWLAFVETVRAETHLAETPILTHVSESLT